MGRYQSQFRVNTPSTRKEIQRRLQDGPLRDQPLPPLLPLARDEARKLPPSRHDAREQLHVERTPRHGAGAPRRLLGYLLQEKQSQQQHQQTQNIPISMEVEH